MNLGGFAKSAAPRRDRVGRNPRVGHRPHRMPVDNVVPEEQAVPAVGLGTDRQVRERDRIGELVKRQPRLNPLSSAPGTGR